jgi:hypothetical protein
MIRDYEKLKKISTNNGWEINNTDASDFTEAFFNRCYHLKDWIKKDPTVSPAIDVEAYINKTGPLRIAADFCNSLKHAGLSRPGRTGGQLDGVLTHINMDIMPGGGTSAQVEIRMGSKKYNAFKLASDCVAAWDRFFKIHGLDVGQP